MTNYERIRELSFEEMAEFINFIIEDGSKTMDRELEENGIEDDFENPWNAVEEVALWLGLEKGGKIL
jgi:hypothetical protein